LPARLKCGRCRKNQPQAKFSIKQLTDARSQVKNINKIITPPVCHDCNSQQKVEIECTMCNKTKGLEAFAKSQRAKPDTARCFKCVDDQLNDTPVNEEMYEQPENAFLAPDHSKGVYPEYWSSAASSTESSSNYVSPSFSVRIPLGDTDNHRVMTSGTLSTAVAPPSVTSVAVETAVSPCLKASSAPCPSTAPQTRA
jgi:hypothetical protein